MKNVLKISQTIFMAIVIVSASSDTYANSDKIVKKVRAAVEKAATDDWKTLAKSAKICIRKNINMEEALTWLNKSVAAISKNPDNLELLGDYYLKTKDTRKAVEYYIETMKAMKAKNFNTDTSRLQEKLRKATK